MQYECKCAPTQEYPHIVRGGSVKRFSLALPTYFYFRDKVGNTNNRIILANLTKRTTPAKSCDNHPVPQKQFEVTIGRLKLSFGKIIY